MQKSPHYNQIIKKLRYFFQTSSRLLKPQIPSNTIALFALSSAQMRAQYSRKLLNPLVFSSADKLNMKGTHHEHQQPLSPTLYY